MYGTARFFNSPRSTWSTCSWSVGRVSNYSRRSAASTVWRGLSSPEFGRVYFGGTPSRSAVATGPGCPYPITALLPAYLFPRDTHPHTWASRSSVDARGSVDWYIGSFGTAPTYSFRTSWRTYLSMSQFKQLERRYTGQFLPGDPVSITFP